MQSFILPKAVLFDAYGTLLDVWFVSCNAWDALAATWFGYQTLWVNRYDLPFEELDTEPTHTGKTLDDVLKIFS
jgi:2-haloacid dehalogenase